jgi:hypothetical protein
LQCGRVFSLRALLQLRVLGFGLLKRSEHLRWYVMTLGGEIDYHTPIGTGNVINIDKHPSDICSLWPTQFIAVDRGLL